MNTYDVGDMVRVAAAFATIPGEPVDPTTVTLTVRHGATTDTITEVTNDGVGSYYYDLPVTEGGLWSYRWAGTGTCHTAAEAEFMVTRAV